ncbi:MAG TPA: F0F1 ATP synthase subunit delta [Burkholderiales bacterium]|nr:F0F1 ATP synthase subunit delta [Burkholderiales bacterium]
MAELATIARPYAEAAFEVADATGKLAAWADALARLAAVASDPEVLQLVGDPGVTPDAVYGVIAGAAGELPVEAQNFLRVLIANGRVAVLPEVYSHFEALKNEREGIVDAGIASAFPLDKAQTAELVTGLEARFKRKVRPHVSVDKELIGGVKVAVGDEVIDGSVRGKLAAMAAALAKV